MACSLVAIDSNTCPESDGGIYEVQVCQYDDITSLTIDAMTQEITDFVMTGASLWETYTPDDDDTAFYNQTGQRANNKHTVQQQGFFKFAGVDATKIQFANAIKDCCQLVAIYRFNSGVALVQGIDPDLDALDGTYNRAKQRAKATVNILSDTGANEDRIEISIDSIGRCFSVATTLTSAQVTALDNM